MKVILFLICFLIFIGSFFLFGYAFVAPTGWDTALFVAGLAAIGISVAVPFHLLERFD